MSVVAIAPLNALTTHLDTLINSLVHTNSYAAAPTAASCLVAADDALTSALATLKQHQQNYARILHLREEAARLEDELKNIIRKAVRLREDVGRIHPSILDDDAETSEEEDVDGIPFGQGKGRDVDYHTLLNFAARIGKHNSLAAREAEQEGERRKVEAIRKRESMTAANIANALANASAPIAATLNAEAGQTEQQPEKDELELQAIGLEESLAAQRAQQGLGYPDGMLLRMGELGRLQKIREDATASDKPEEAEMRVRAGFGEEAVEREIERLVRESEDVATKEDPELERKLKLEQERREREEQEKKRKDEARKATVQAPSRPRRESVTQRPPVAAPKRKKINLDFGDDDDDDD